MVLSDRDIKNEIESGGIVIDPFDLGAIQPASIDLRLGRDVRVFQSHLLQAIDPKQELPQLTALHQIDEVNPFILHPGEFALGVTLEEVGLPDYLVGRLDGKSSLGRVGLVVHSTAGFVDPGWRGCLTLELSNLAHLPINLYFGMKISQLSFMQLSSPVEKPYGSKGLGSKYQGQMGPTPSRFYMNYKSSAGVEQPLNRRAEGLALVLREWLDSSSFGGSVIQFADAIGVNIKTVENWVYGRAVPSKRYWPRLYKTTRLPEFAVLGEDLLDRGS